jgi:hypothetical protein
MGAHTVHVAGGQGLAIHACGLTTSKMSVFICVKQDARNLASQSTVCFTLRAARRVVGECAQRPGAAAYIGAHCFSDPAPETAYVLLRQSC